jgi:hypothetical protein
VLKKQKILNIGSFVLLFTFLLNSVPKIYLHDVFAKHCHKEGKKNTTKNAEGNHIKAVSNCGHEKLFTEVLYDGVVAETIFSNTAYTLTTNTVVHTLYNAPVSSKDYCGPPTLS